MALNINCQICHVCVLDMRKPVLRIVNIECTDQHAHPRRLLSAFVIGLVESIISKLTTGIGKLVSVGEQDGLNLTWP